MVKIPWNRFFCTIIVECGKCNSMVIWPKMWQHTLEPEKYKEAATKKKLEKKINVSHRLCRRKDICIKPSLIVAQKQLSAQLHHTHSQKGKKILGISVWTSYSKLKNLSFVVLSNSCSVSSMSINELLRYKDKWQTIFGLVFLRTVTTVTWRVSKRQNKLSLHDFVPPLPPSSALFSFLWLFFLSARSASSALRNDFSSSSSSSSSALLF